MEDESSSPNTDRYKQTGHNRRNNTDNHNGLLMGGRISIDNHRGERKRLCKGISESKKESERCSYNTQTFIAEKTQARLRKRRKRPKPALRQMHIFDESTSDFCSASPQAQT